MLLRLQKELSFIADGDKNSLVILEDSLVLSYRNEPILTISSRKCILGIHPNGLKNLFLLKTCTWIFMSTLFTIAKGEGRGEK
jgi:hypothetical protein